MIGRRGWWGSRSLDSSCRNMDGFTARYRSTQPTIIVQSWSNQKMKRQLLIPAQPVYVERPKSPGSHLYSDGNRSESRPMAAPALIVAFSAILVFLTGVIGARGDELLVKIDRPAADGLVVAPVDLTAAARWCHLEVVPAGIQAVTVPGGQAVPCQFLPDEDFDVRSRATGLLLVQLPAGSDGQLRLSFTPTPAKTEAWDGHVQLPGATLRHDAKRQGGFPTEITFADGKRLDHLRWNDRLHDPKLGGFNPTSDPEAKVRLVGRGPLGTLVRVVSRYLQGGKAPASTPQAVYDWLYLAGRPVVFVRASITQKEPQAWKEIHFLEMDYPGEALPAWVGGEPKQGGKFTASKKSSHASLWGAVLDGSHAVGMFQAGQILFYDGGPGTYLHAHGDAAWHGWNDTQRQFSAWLWLGSDPHPAETIQAIALKQPVSSVAVSVSSVRDRVEQARRAFQSASPAQRQTLWWQAAGAAQLESQGRFEEAIQTAAAKRPDGWTVVTAGNLGMILQRTAGGVRLGSLYDLSSGRSLLAAKPLPLFRLSLQQLGTKDKLQLDAESGWTRCEVVSASPAVTELRWQQPTDQRLGQLRVVAQATADSVGAIRWKLRVEGTPSDWNLRDVRFPQVAVADLGPKGNVLFPRGCGEVQQDVWQRAFSFRGTYPAGWTTMQFLAAYDQEGTSGLYVASHDPWGSTKELFLESKPLDRAVTMVFEHPAIGLGVGGNGFELSGEAVWQVLHGNWFDAAVIYRDWVRREAKWYPRLGPDGRADTPLWMRELSAWAQTGGKPSECAEQVKEFAKFLGVPVGFHWYNWHRIPFDNDYPHYFPTKPGFTEAVADLQRSGVYVMPYINGRLWDTRDKGAQDFEFTRLALPAATKNEEGKPYVESYSSKESDGSKVSLAAMCPTTELWRKTMLETVMRLFGECGVKGVYMDQIAAARPVLCVDPTHGHPLGGGHWWTEGYWALLAAIRKAMPSDRMLTTECNAESYTQMFDGYLSWHWQHDGQVPAFSAVYGGAIQMFGRAYGGGPTKNLALRMKAGEQLVFGEQIGWLSPGVIREKDNGAFLRQVIRLRHAMRRYFYAGEMARPPKLKLPDAMPRVTADWQWHGHWPVTTDALLTSVWQIPAEKKAVIFLVNVSDEPVQATLDFDAARYALPAGSLRLTRVESEGPVESAPVSRTFQREFTAAPHQAWAWEISSPKTAAATPAASSAAPGSATTVNELTNPDFEEVASQEKAKLSGWKPQGQGYSLDTQAAHRGQKSISCESNRMDQTRGVGQVIRYEKPDRRPIVVGGWSKAQDVSGAGDYCIYMDIVYEDGTPWWGQTSRWTAGTHNWQYTAHVFYPEKPVREIRVYVFLRRLQGKVWFDDLFLHRGGLHVTDLRMDSDFPRTAYGQRIRAQLTHDADWRCTVLDAAGRELESQTGHGKTISWNRDSRPDAMPVKLKITAQARGQNTASLEMPVAMPARPVNPIRTGYALWWQSAMHKVYPTEFPPPDRPKEVSLSLARNEREGFQLALSTADDAALKNVEVSFSPLVNERGETLPADQIEQHLVGYVYVDSPSGHPDAPATGNWCPEVLLPPRAFDVPGGRTQSVWINFHALESTRPGIYRGKVTVRPAGLAASEMPLAVRVRNFTLPRTPRMKTAFAMMDGYTRAAYGTITPELRRRCLDLMLSHRLNPDDISRVDPPAIADVLYASERGLNTFNIANVVPKPKDNPLWVCLAPLNSYGPKFNEEFAARVDDCVKELRKHGLSKMAYFYGFDERGTEYDELIKGICKFLKERYPEIRTFTTAGYMYEKRHKTPPDYQDYMDWYCPLTPRYDRALSAKLRAQGKQVWWYVCCGPSCPYANFASMDYPTIEARLLSWMTFGQEADGLLYWHVNLWHPNRILDIKDPYLDWKSPYIAGTTGDGCLTYPTPDGPVSSIRLENIRDGIEDYDYLALLADTQGREAAEKAVGRLVKSMTEFSRDPAALEAVRAELADRLEASR